MSSQNVRKAAMAKKAFKVNHGSHNQKDHGRKGGGGGGGGGSEMEKHRARLEKEYTVTKEKPVRKNARNQGTYVVRHKGGGELNRFEKKKSAESWKQTRIKDVLRQLRLTSPGDFDKSTLEK